MNNICSIRAIANRLKVSIKTIERLENDGIIKLRRNSSGFRYCTPAELDSIEELYWSGNEIKNRIRKRRMKSQACYSDVNPKIIEQVYKENIKRFGEITCYICLKPIKFSYDCIEHKTPLSRGGTNEYKNLEVSCISCNAKKGRMTIDEYLKCLKKSQSVVVGP